MSNLFGQTSQLETVRPGEGELGIADPAPRPFQQGNQEQALFRFDIKRSFELHRRLAITVALFGIAMAVAYFFKMWPVYEASSLVYVSPAPGKILDGGAQPFAFDGASYQSYLQQQMVDVTRNDVLVSALHKLEAGSWQFSGESDQASAERLSNAIDVKQNGSYQFTIAARSNNPDLAAKLANAVTNSYIESTSREQKSGDAERVKILQAERDRVEKELNADRAEQEALNAQLGVAGVGNNAPDFLDDDIGRTRAELVKARTDHDQAEAKFTSMDAGSGTASAAIDAQADEMAAIDPGLTSMKTSLNQRRAALLTQMANLTPNHPEYKQDAAELAKINTNLDSTMKELRTKAAGRIEEQLRTDLERTAGVEDQLNGQLRGLVATAGGTTIKMQRSSDLAADITRLRARYATVDEQMHNIMLDQVAPGAIYLTDAAVPPLHTAKSSAVRNAFLLGFGSILLGLMAAVGAHKMDQKLYIASDVEQILGFAPMAQWPDFKEVPDEVAEEHVLRLSAAIDYAHKQGTLNSCMFTGTGAGAGTSTVASRVCDTLEAMGRPTVLVDASGAEVPAPRTESASQTTASRGGRSLAMLQQLAEEAKLQEESFVITDTAPLAVSAETEYLARFVDCAIIVIESGVTTRAQLRATADSLQKLDVASVGFVMNRVKLGTADSDFRNSVRAIENHLRYQKRSTGKRATSSRHLAAQSSSEPKPTEQQPAARKQQESPAPPPAAQASSTPPVPPVRLAAPAAPERAAALTPTPARAAAASTASSPAPATRPGIKMPAVRPMPQPAPGVESVPWWLSDLEAAQPETPASAAPSLPVRVQEPEMAPVVRPRQPEAAAARMREIEMASARAREAEMAAARAREAEMAAAVARETAMAEQRARAAQAEEDLHPGAARLSGLRNILFSLGLNNLNKTRDSAPQQDQPLPPREAEVQPVAYHRTFVPFTEPVSDDSSRVVTTTPEFLPPQAEPKAAARRDRRDSYDDVEILPSWRGQYKRKD